MEDNVRVPRVESIVKTAALLHLPVHFIRAAVANGDIVAVRAGRKFLVNIDSVIAFLNTRIPQGTAANVSENDSRSDVKNAPRIAPIHLR